MTTDGTGGVLQDTSPVRRRERFAWAFYDFANSGYTTVVLTTVFNAYFVAVIAGDREHVAPGSGTLLWTLAISVANALVLLSGPVLGAIADRHAAKKRLLAATTVGCVVTTALLGAAGPGDVTLAMGLLVLSFVAFASGEHLIAAFLPEIVPSERLGRYCQLLS
jgi:UMF1 family MFS transporter